MDDESVLSLDTRRLIFEYVRAHPGAHLRAIARWTGYPLGTVLYHLDCLETAERVTVTRDGRYKRYFVKHMLGRRDKVYVSAFHHAVPRAIALALLAKGSRTQRELCRDVGVSRSTLSFHVNNLVTKGIVACHERWPENSYSLAEGETARAILARYRETFHRNGTRPRRPLPARGPGGCPP